MTRSSCSRSAGTSHTRPLRRSILENLAFATPGLGWQALGASLRGRRAVVSSLLAAGVGLLPPWPTAPAQAQPSFSIQAGRALDAISFTADDSSSRGVTSVAGAAEVELAAERLRLHYAFDAQTYSTPGDWLSLLHRGGATWRAAFGPQAAHSLFAGGTLALRFNGESWAAADYRGAAAFLNLELRPAPTLVVRSGYQVDRRAFPDLPILDQTEQRVFGSLLVNLPTRTTIIGEVASGWKSYHGAGATAVAAPHMPGLATASPGNGAGMGMGAVAGAGQRRGAGRFVVVSAVSPGFRAGDGAARTTARQVTVFGRVAQSLAARLGLSVDVSARNVFGRVPPALVTTPAGFFDDGVYDDPYASEARTVRATLKRVWPSLAEVSGSLSWADRRYTSTPAFGLDGVPRSDGSLRRDDIRLAGVALRLPLAPDRTGRFELALIGSYGWLRHRSTDAFYHYTSHSVGVGLSLGY